MDFLCYHGPTVPVLSGEVAVQYALLSMVFLGIVDFLYKRAQLRGVRMGSFLATTAIFYGSTAFSIGVVGQTFTLTGPIFLYGAATGLSSFAAISLFLRSLQSGEAGVSTMIYRLNFVLVAIMGIIFLSEPARLLKALGLVSACGSIAMVALGGRRLKGLGDGYLASIGWALGAMVLYGAVTFIFKLGARAGYSTPSIIFTQFLFFFASALTVALLKEKIHVVRALWTYGPAVGIIHALANLFMVHALRRGEASVVAPVAQMSFAVTAALALFLFKERLTSHKALGFLLAALAVYLLSRR